MQNIYYRKQKYFKAKFIFYTLGEIPSFLFLALLVFYQWTLSPDHGIVSLYTIGRCKFRPTCSQHTKEMIKKFGALKGAKLGFRQIIKCH